MRRLTLPFITLMACLLTQVAIGATVIGSHRVPGVSFEGERFSSVSQTGMFAAGNRHLEGEWSKALLVRYGAGPTPAFTAVWPTDGEAMLSDVEEISIDGRVDAIVCGRIGFGGYLARINGNTGAIVWELPIWSDFGADIATLIVRPGGIYAAGRYSSDIGDDDFYTVKVDPANGHLLWDKKFDSDTGGAAGIATDLGGNVFVSGVGNVLGKSAKQFIVAKYSSAGTYLGKGSFGTNFAGHDPYGGSMVCDGVNVLVTGTLYNGETRLTDSAAVCFDNSLVPKWSHLEDMESDEDFAWKGAFDGAGNAYMLAEAHGVNDRWLTRIYSYTPSGTLRFTFEDGPVGYYTGAQDFVVLWDGRCYYAGYSNGVGNNNFYIGAMQDNVRLWTASRGAGTAWGIASNNGIVTAVGDTPYPSNPTFDMDPYCVTVRENLEAVSDFYTVREGEQFSVNAAFGVLRNDRFNQGPGNVSLFQSAAHGTVELDGDGAFRYMPNNGYLGSDTFQYRWTYGIGTSTATVTLNVVLSVKNLNINPTIIAGIGTVPAAVDLTSAAPTGGVVVNLTTDGPTLITLSKPSVSVPAGGTTAAFYLKPVMVTTTQNVVVTAFLNGVARSKTLTLRPLRPTALSVTPNPAWGGATTSGRVVLDGLAGSGGQVVTILDNSSFVTSPASVTVPMSASAATFALTTQNPSSTQNVTLTAKIGAYTVTRSFLLNRIYAQSLTLQPSTVPGGSSTTATVRLNGPAPPGGAQVSVFDSSVYVTPPATVLVPAGATSAQFAIATSPVGFIVNCGVRATYNGVTGSATLTVTP